MLSANWAVTSIDTADLENGYRSAFWRLFKYVNKANNQGVRLTSSIYIVSKWSLGGFLGKVEGGQMAVYIPSAFQANPPAPTDSQVSVENWDDVVTYDRVFGGDRPDNLKALTKAYRLLKRSLKQEGIEPDTSEVMTFEYVKPGCGSQRSEVAVVGA